MSFNYSLLAVESMNYLACFF